MDRANDEDQKSWQKGNSIILAFIPHVPSEDQPSLLHILSSSDLVHSSERRSLAATHCDLEIHTITAMST